MPVPRGPGAPESRHPTPGCSRASRWCRRVPTKPARSPSHLHLPGLAAAMMPPTSPGSAPWREAGETREGACVNCRHRLANPDPERRWVPSAGGSTLLLLMGQGGPRLSAGEGVSARSLTAKASQADDVKPRDSHGIMGAVVPRGTRQGSAGLGGASNCQGAKKTRAWTGDSRSFVAPEPDHQPPSRKKGLCSLRKLS